MLEYQSNKLHSFSHEHKSTRIQQSVRNMPPEWVTSQKIAKIRMSYLITLIDKTWLWFIDISRWKRIPRSIRDIKIPDNIKKLNWKYQSHIHYEQTFNIFCADTNKNIEKMF